MSTLLIGITPPQEGGSERHIYEISKRIADSKVLTQSDSICENKIPIKLPETHILRVLFFMFSVLFRVPTILASDYRAVHIHENYLFFFIPIFRIRFKVIATVHGINGFRFYDNKILWVIYRFFLGFANSIIAVNKEDEKKLSRELKNVVYIPNGVDLSLYSNTSPKIEKKFSFIGRIHEQKGIIFLLQAFSKIKKQFPDFRLEILGKVNPYAEGLQKRFPQQGVIWRGFISNRNEIVKSLKSSYCIILPSIWEGLPLTLLESLASSRPLIISNIPAFRSIIKTEAVFFKSKDSDDLAKKMKLIIEDKAYANLIGKKGEELAREYDWKSISKKIEAMY